MSWNNIHKWYITTRIPELCHEILYITDILPPAYQSYVIEIIYITDILPPEYQSYVIEIIYITDTLPPAYQSYVMKYYT